MKTVTAKCIHLKGDPRSPEAAQHIISFPGGSIELVRTDDNEYWAHIAVHKGQVLHDIPSQSLRGTVVDSRIDRTYHAARELGIQEIEDLPSVEHIAVRIAPSWGE